jgi:hypothetical protein
MKVHNLVVTGSLTSGGENISTISSSVATTVTELSSSLTSSIGSLSSSMVTMITNMSSSITASIGSMSSSMSSRFDTIESTTGSLNSFTSSAIGRLNSVEVKTGSFATTGSNLFVGTQTISGSIIPAVDNTYDLGSTTQQFRDLYLSSASLYIDGVKVLGSTAQELQITTDAGQSFKILEAGSDTITLQSNDGNITLATSGGGDVILDPTTGIIALKGTTTIYAGNRVLSSDGNAIQFGNSVTMTGSLIVTGFIETQELRTTYISSSILYRSGSTKFGDELTDTHAFSGSVLISGSISVPESNLVSGSAQITYSGLSGIPSGIVSGSAQIISALPAGTVSGSSQVLNGTTIHSGSFFNGISVVSGSAQITLSSTTGYGSVLNQAVLTSSSPTFAGLTNNGTYSQATTSTQPITIYGDSAGSNGLFRIQIDEVNDSFGTGTRTYLGDGGIDIFLGTGNSSYTPSNTYIALNHSGEISMGAGSATKHIVLSTSGNFNIGYSSDQGAKLYVQANQASYTAYFEQVGGATSSYGGVRITTNSTGVNSLYIDNAGTERFSVKGSGVVHIQNALGIGYSDPQYTLQVLNTIGLRANSQNIKAITGTGWGYSPSSYKVVMLGDTANNVTVSIGYDPSGNANSAFSGDGREVLFRNGASFATPTSANTAFHLNTLVMKDGKVGVGAADPAHTLDVTGNIRINQTVAYLYFTATTTNRYLAYNGADTYWRADGIHYFEKTSGYKGSWDANSNLTVNGTITESSALRYKENINSLENSLDKVSKLRGVSYVKKETGLKEFGFIAEEVILPELVLRNPSGEIESVAYGRFVSVLAEAIKELKAEIEVLKQNK